MKQLLGRRKPLPNTVFLDGEVYPYVDATEDLLIEVKQSDVDKAKAGDPNHCVIAEATRRQFDFAHVQRSVATVFRILKGKKTGVRYKLSKAAVLAVKEYDKGGNFPTGVFKLKAVSHSSRLDIKRENNKKWPKRNARKNKPKTVYMVRANKPASFA